jgi:ArsR family transcriptional regulator, cadmium/lead-responsive transcriptional repressor
MNGVVSVHSTSQVSPLMALAADPNRLAILRDLAEGDLHVGGMCQRLGLRQQAVSHHLTICRLRGVVVRRRQGKRNYYSLTPRGLQLLKAVEIMA